MNFITSRMNNIQAIDKYAARALMAGFFLPMALQAIMITAVCIYFTCRVVAGKRPVAINNILWALALGSGFLLYLGAVPLTSVADRPELMMLIGRRASSLLMPVAFAVIMPSFGALIIKELKFFVYACIIICVAANAAFLCQHYFAGIAPSPLSHVAYRQYLEHFTGLHPTYLSMYIAFAICILLCGWVNCGKAIKFAILYSLVLFLFAILAKSPLIAFIIITAHFCYYRRSHLLKYSGWVSIMALALAGGCFFIPFIGQRVGELFVFGAKQNQTVDANNSIFIRKLIWGTDINMLKHYWLTGMGPARLTRLLDYRYFFYSIEHTISIGYYDPHNEYLWEWLSFGVAGIGISVGVLLIHLTKAFKTRNHLYLYLLIILCVTFFTESVLSRQQGILFYVVFTSAMFFYKPGAGRSMPSKANL